MRWFGLTALPILYAAMALIGAIVCLRLSRLGGTSRLIATGAAAATAGCFMSQVASSFGSSGAVPAIIAAWAPALCALFISLTILAYQEDG
jgi:lipopolysaccharide export system permease protein